MEACRVTNRRTKDRDPLLGALLLQIEEEENMGYDPAAWSVAVAGRRRRREYGSALLRVKRRRRRRRSTANEKQEEYAKQRRIRRTKNLSF